ncbi:hypothetical protein K9N68_17990 [Kovacikia minuta CCNUW1]|uniref:hypothetical protein n=1 Tax=Kovacikia minuta TaxID=2931930 RepID=UPI001CCA51C2|nr:hypothetical protein [Kovacikia minuta]UBF23663.1 hypothetical protein K9N68_17990 [Kovacikia minuta CCNUW1]
MTEDYSVLVIDETDGNFRAIEGQRDGARKFATVNLVTGGKATGKGAIMLKFTRSGSAIK